MEERQLPSEGLGTSSPQISKRSSLDSEQAESYFEHSSLTGKGILQNPVHRARAGRSKGLRAYGANKL